MAEQEGGPLFGPLPSKGPGPLFRVGGGVGFPSPTPLSAPEAGCYMRPEQEAPPGFVFSVGNIGSIFSRILQASQLYPQLENSLKECVFFIL